MGTITINTLPGSVKKTNLALYSFVTTLCCAIALFFSTATIAQSVSTSKLSCTSGHCTSKDLSVVNVFVDLGPCATCNGGSVTAPLKMTIHNGTKSTRTSFALYGTLSSGSINGVSGNIFVCVGPITVGSGDDIGFGLGNQTFTVGTITFNCNQTLTLTNNFLAWTDASGTTTDRCNTFSNATQCSDIEPKCGTAASITIQQPLSASYTTTPGCTGRSAGKIKVTPIGGTSPYTIALKKAGVTIATQSNVTGSGYEFTGLAEGTDYSALVTDATNPPATHCTFTLTPITLGSVFCCTAPTVLTNPSDAAKCFGSTASFTATPSGGDPAPTTKWQFRSSSAGTFADLTIAGVYSLTNSNNTLNISSVNGLNGYQFRAVFTSGDCAPAITNPATLTVNPLPAAGISGTTAVCKDATAPNVTFTGSGGTAPYTFTYKINGGSNLTVTTTSGNSVNVAAPTGTAGSFVYSLVSVQDASSTTCSQAQSGSATITVNSIPSAPTACFVLPSLCFNASGTPTGAVVFNDLGTGYQYSINNGSSWQDCRVFPGLAPGSVTGLKVKSGAGCISPAADCSTIPTCASATLPTCSSSPTTSRTIEQTAIALEPTVKAYPNPFSDKVKFAVNAPAAGNGSLEIYNMLGQKVKTVYQGYINAGDNQFELSIPKKQQTTLFYIFRIGDKKISGKLLQLNN